MKPGLVVKIVAQSKKAKVEAQPEESKIQVTNEVWAILNNSTRITEDRGPFEANYMKIGRKWSKPQKKEAPKLTLNLKDGTISKK